jgi:hypothetical protein
MAPLREEHIPKMFQNRVLRRIFGRNGVEAVGEWRKLYIGELHNLYLSPNIIRQFKSRRMRWAGHVARMGEERKVYKVLARGSEGKNHWKDQAVDGRIGSEWVVGRSAGRMWTGFTWLSIGTGGGLL